MVSHVMILGFLSNGDWDYLTRTGADSIQEPDVAHISGRNSWPGGKAVCRVRTRPVYVGLDVKTAVMGYRIGESLQKRRPASM
jgi:hypothetical protein